MSLASLGVVGREEHVDVAGVVELVAAQLAHTNYRQAGGVGQRDGVTQDGIGHVRKGRTDGLEVVDAEQVPRRDAQQLQPFPPPHAVGFVDSDGDRPSEVGEDLEGARVRQAQLGERPAGRGHGDEGLCKRAVLPEAIDHRWVGLADALSRHRRPRRRG